MTSNRKISGYTQARQGIAIMVLLGLTWIFGILAIDDAKRVFQYLFAIFNTLQGFFVFLFFVILPSGTRNHLRQFTRKHTKEKANHKEHRVGSTNTGNNVNNLENTINSSTPNTKVGKHNLNSEDNSSPAKAKTDQQVQVTLAIGSSKQDSVSPGSKFLDKREILPKTALNPGRAPNDVFFNVTRHSVKHSGCNYYRTTIEK